MYLYENTQMHPSGWNKDVNWDTEKRVNTWYGVRVDEGAHAVSVILSSNRVMGRLWETPRLKQLVNLRSLFLNSNFLKGPLPESLGDLVSLEELNVAWNEFEGPIPDRLYTLTRLTVLRLDNNRLTGGLSDQLRNLQALRLIDVSNNQLTGNIPFVAGEGTYERLGVCKFIPGNLFELPIPATALEFKDYGPGLEDEREAEEAEPAPEPEHHHHHHGGGHHGGGGGGHGHLGGHH